ncbi:MAG: hypothetical protein AUK48_05350 [Oscillatoriales cyanobacterium CG2_30_44_21]|nr:MAG: hypothetical protein AUK48_05350 [Oscillatoriales cyanobacterium CG2_30_44_21]
MSVLLYWLVIGAPLCLLIYTSILKLETSSAILVMLKQALNGIFNALIAHLLIDYLPLSQWLSKISSQKTVSRDRPKIQQILFNLLLAFVFLPVLSIASLTGYQSLQYIYSEISTQLSSNSIELSENVRAWHDQQLLILRKLAAIATESDFPKDLVRLQFATEALAKISPSFLRLYVEDAQANMITTFPQVTNAENSLEHQVEKKIFEQVKTTLNPVVSDVHTNKYDPAPHINIVVPMLKNGQFNGIVGVALDIAELKELLIKTTSIRKVDALILGRSQQVIASTIQRVQFGDTWDLNENGKPETFRQKNQILWLPTTSSSPMTRWRKSFYIQKTTVGGDTPWTVVVKLSPVRFIDTLENLHTYILLIVLGIVFVATWVASLISRRFVKPLAKLVRLTTDLQTDISQSANFVWKYSELAEIDTLGDNFHSMAIALQEHFQEIQQTNLTLEQRIEERSHELLQSEIKLEKITDAVLGAVYQFKRDPEGNYSALFMSRGAYDIYEVDREEICRDVLSIINLALPEELEGMISSIEESAQALTPWIYECRIRTPSGKIKWISGRSQPLRQEDGSTVWNGIVTDITKLKLTEQALQKSEERWQLAIQSSDSGIWDWDIASGVTFRSDQWWTMLGFESGVTNEQEVDWTALIHPDDRAYHLQQQDDYLNQKIPRFSVESRMQVKDGSYRWILTRGVAVWNQQQQAIRLVGTNSDVTDLKIARLEMTQAMEEAQAANRAKSEFLATMSHEIRTPMNAVIGMASLLLDSQLDDEQQEFAEIIRSSGDNLLTIINSILDFSKIESGRFNLDLQTFNLRICIEECFDVMTTLASPKGIELAYCIDLEVPEWIESDATRLRQILINLLSNAIKFTAQGTVTLQVGLEDAALHPPSPQKLLFQIKDTGIGIPCDRYDRLFKAFSQVDSSTTRQYGGTGLGLAISKRLTELMGGGIWVESELGVGSCFSFVISVTPSQAYAEFDESRDYDYNYYAQLSGRNLLLLEDNPVCREGLSNLAKSFQMQVWQTTAVTEAIALIEGGQKFDFAIIDADIPLTNNQQTANQTHQINSLRQQFPLLPIVFLTYGHKSEINLISDSLTSYTNRPAKRSQIYAKLSKFIENNGAVEPSAPKSIPEFDSDFANKFPLTILLAEDNLVNQKVAVRFLNRLGYIVDIAENGCEVIDLMHQKDYDIILMDIHMPVMDGVTATKEILGNFKVPPWIVALTANASNGDREFYLEVGMNDYVSKPIHIKELTKVLKTAYQALDSAQ